jgi:hypothetical protein
VSLVLTSERRKLTEPVESVTVIFGTVMLIVLAIFIVFTVFGTAMFHGFDQAVCVSPLDLQTSDSGWALPHGIAARPGYDASIDGVIQACALRPGVAQRALYTIAYLSAVAVWGWILLLVWRIIRVARRSGPFTPAVATAMRRLGWVVLGGTFAAAFVRTFIVDLQLSAMVTLPINQFPNLIWEPVKAIVPGPALAGAALLTFARIIKLGAAMDDEMQGTV